MDQPSEQLLEAQQRYFLTQNRVNLLLIKEQKLKKEQSEYCDELKQINRLLAGMNHNNSKMVTRGVAQEDLYLRNMYKQNCVKIHRLEKQLMGEEELKQKNARVSQEHDSYKGFFNGEVQKKTREILGTLRGRIEQLRRKCKQLVKDITTIEEQFKGHVDQIALQNTLLKIQEERVEKMKQQLQQKLEMSKSSSHGSNHRNNNSKSQDSRSQ